jgi:hypothetical protein
MTHKLPFKPKTVVAKLLKSLPTRARDIITKRYGLGKDSKTVTLEAIGQEYGITRERVRQVENYALATIRKSDAFAEQDDAFQTLEKTLRAMGGIVREDELLEELAADASTRNHLHLMLVLGDSFVKEKESADFHHRWHVDPDISRKVHESLRNLYDSLSDDELIEESELIDTFLRELRDINAEYANEEVLKRWMNISKRIGKNPLGEWGRSHSPNVKVKGIRDYAYLVIKRHGSPMHFREVAQTITELFKRKAHEATCHNELIKDPRFVLVGRGMYALEEWGYYTGPVREVILDVLREKGPMTREEVVDAVRTERYVKDNTIFINLQDTAHFGKDEQGRYFPREQRKN